MWEVKIKVDGKHVSQLCRCYGCGGEVTSNFCFACEFPDKLGPELRHYGANDVAEAADQSNPISGTEGVKSNFNCLGGNHSNPSCGNVGVTGQESFGGDQSKSARSKEGVAADEFVSMHVVRVVGEVSGGRMGLPYIPAWELQTSFSPHIFVRRLFERIANLVCIVWCLFFCGAPDPEMQHPQYCSNMRSASYIQRAICTVLHP